MKEDKKRIKELIHRNILPSDKPNKNGRVYSEALVQEMVKKMRKLNEQEEETEERVNKKTAFDQEKEEKKFSDYFNDLNVDVKYDELLIYDDLIFWSGTIDGVVQFVYKVTPEDVTSGVDFNYLEDFDIDNPDNDEIVSRVESYYDDFYKYWRDNVLNM